MSRTSARSLRGVKRVELWHPESPGTRVTVRPSLLRRLGVIRSEFATSGESLTDGWPDWTYGTFSKAEVVLPNGRVMLVAPGSRWPWDRWHWDALRGGEWINAGRAWSIRSARRRAAAARRYRGDGNGRNHP